MKIDDNYVMKQALKVANDAIIKGEVPVGAVIVFNGKVIARAHNQTENLKDVTAISLKNTDITIHKGI